MIARAAILRRRAGLLAELSQLDLELASLEAVEEGGPPKRKPRRMAVIAPPTPLPPINEPSDLDMARAKAALRKLGYRSTP